MRETWGTAQGAGIEKCGGQEASFGTGNQGGLPREGGIWLGLEGLVGCGDMIIEMLLTKDIQRLDMESKASCSSE